MVANFTCKRNGCGKQLTSIKQLGPHRTGTACVPKAGPKQAVPVDELARAAPPPPARVGEARYDRSWTRVDGQPASLPSPAAAAEKKRKPDGEPRTKDAKKKDTKTFRPQAEIRKLFPSRPAPATADAAPAGAPTAAAAAPAAAAAQVAPAATAAAATAQPSSAAPVSDPSAKPAADEW